MQTPKLLLPVLVIVAAVTASGCKKKDHGGGSSCTPGTADCACIDGETCEEGLACVDGMCRSAGEVSLGLSDADARSCEILFTEETSRITDVTFGGSVRGKMVREAPLVGVSVINGDDEPFAAGFMTLQIVGDTTPTVTRIRCFDGDGTALSGVTLEGT